MANKDTGLGADIKDLVQTLRDYAKQETLGPLKGVGRYLRYGVLGGVAMALALLFSTLGMLRGFQQVSWFDGNWSIVPYFLTLLAVVTVLALAGRAVMREANRS